MDEEIAELLEKLAAGHFADKLVEASSACAESLQAEGHCQSLEQLEKAPCGGTFLTFEDVEGDASSPRRTYRRSWCGRAGLGEIFDAVAPTCVRSSALYPATGSTNRRRRSNGWTPVLKKVLAAVAVLRAAQRNVTTRNPRVALSVVNLEKVTGNNALASLFVRVGVDGRLLYLGGFRGRYLHRRF